MDQERDEMITAIKANHIELGRHNSAIRFLFIVSAVQAIVLSVLGGLVYTLIS